MIKSIPEWSEQEYLMLSLPHEKSDWKPYLDEILQGYKEFIKAVSEFQKVLLIAPKKAILLLLKIYPMWNFLCVIQMILGYAILAQSIF